MSSFESIGCHPVINASGKMTALGASAVTETVARSMATAAQDYVNIDQLLRRAGTVIGAATGAEDGVPTTGAASAVVLAVAALIAGEDLTRIEAIPESTGVPNEIVLQKGHAIHFGSAITQLVRLGGGVPIEVGQVNHTLEAHLRGSISERTAGLLFVQSHHTVQKGMQSLAATIEAAHEAGLPVIVDAAAEEDLRRYISAGADLVAYSGGKALGGPTSGFLCGRADLIAAARAQYAGVGRPMKVGKEAIIGLCTALEEYRDGPPDSGRLRDVAQYVVDELQGVRGIRSRVTQDEAGREIWRATVTVDPTEAGFDAVELSRRLREGTPAIHTRDHLANTGSISIDPRPLREGQERIIVERIIDIIEGESGDHS
ncbi:DgaE family pyridoxal phosphate-dependent ammonia lyase [Enemella sp. A6]|uniref:DgaE family pyridoxal phosphate-dependent ammonia lyase n=1 Tax=Enemella sp. A6 TaxID=3440152 RepID=UPI003EBA0AB2